MKEAGNIFFSLSYSYFSHPKQSSKFSVYWILKIIVNKSLQAILRTYILVILDIFHAKSWLEKSHKWIPLMLSNQSKEVITTLDVTQRINRCFHKNFHQIAFFQLYVKQLHLFWSIFFQHFSNFFFSTLSFRKDGRYC